MGTDKTQAGQGQKQNPMQQQASETPELPEAEAARRKAGEPLAKEAPHAAKPQQA